MTNANILIVQENDPGVTCLGERLEVLGFTGCTVSSGQEAIEEAARTRPGLALIDLALAGSVSGVEAGEQIGSQFDIPVIYLADDASEDMLRKSRKTRPFGYLLKTAPERQLHLNIQTALLTHERERSHAKTKTRLEETIAAQRNQANLMKSVFDSMSDGVMVADEAGNCLFANPASEKIVGMNVTDVPLTTRSEAYDLFYPDGKTLFPFDELPLVRAMRGEAVNGAELFVRIRNRPKGIYVSVNAIPLVDDKDEITGGVAVFHDITKAKNAEIHLRQTISKLEDQSLLMETVLREISDGVVVTDAQGEVVIASRSAYDILGEAPPGARDGERRRKNIFYLGDGHTLVPAGELPVERALEGEQVDAMELFVRSRGKSEGIFINSSSRPLRDDTGRIEGAVSVFRDVTRIRETEEELKETADQLLAQTRTMEAVFNSISDGVIVADEKGELAMFNPSAERIVGIDRTDTAPGQGRDQYGIFFTDRETPIPADELPLVRAIRGETSDEVDMFIRNPKVPNGVFINVSGSPLLDASGKNKGGVAVFREVTERIVAEEALTQAFSQGRLEIVGTILHNIGNAINSVAIGVGTIRDQVSRSELINRLSAVADALERHQDDLASYLQTDPQGQEVGPFVAALAQDFAKLQAHLDKVLQRVEGQVVHIVDIVRTQKSVDEEPMLRKDIGLRSSLDYAVGLLEGSLSKRNIQVNIDSRNAPEKIRIQENRFNQMLVNLIKNAIEAIDELEESGGLEAKPRINIRAYVEKNFLVLEVIDNGIGIAEKRFKVIFTPGYTTKEDGSGLGLHSTANFVTGSGGRIYPVSDGFGKGTTMRVMLRLSSVSLAARGRG